MINVDSSCSGCMMVDAVTRCMCMLVGSIQMNVSMIRTAHRFAVPRFVLRPRHHCWLCGVRTYQRELGSKRSVVQCFRLFDHRFPIQGHCDYGGNGEGLLCGTDHLVFQLPLFTSCDLHVAHRLSEIGVLFANEMEESSLVIVRILCVQVIITENTMVVPCDGNMAGDGGTG